MANSGLVTVNTGEHCITLIADLFRICHKHRARLGANSQQLTLESTGLFRPTVGSLLVQ